MKGNWSCEWFVCVRQHLSARAGKGKRLPTEVKPRYRNHQNKKLASTLVAFLSLRSTIQSTFFPYKNTLRSIWGGEPPQSVDVVKVWLGAIRTWYLYSQRLGYQRSCPCGCSPRRGSALHPHQYGRTCSRGGRGSRHHRAGGSAGVWAASPMSAEALAADSSSWLGWCL